MQVTVPDLSLVLLIGPSGSGKSTFARTHFKPSEVLSSDFCRALVADDENDQGATRDAFDVLRYIAGKRLASGRLTVVDATSVKPEDRRIFVELAREHDVLPVALVFDLDPRLCAERNAARPDRDFGPHVVVNHSRALRRGLRGLSREGFRHVTILGSPEQVDAVAIVRERLWTDRRGDHGPFDIVGDVHGCREELLDLLARLGYSLDEGVARHPDGRRLIFLGDLADRGPDAPAVLRLVMASVAAGTALCVPGNHDVKLERKLRGRDVQLTHGLDLTMSQLAAEPPEFLTQLREFLGSLVSHYVLADGALVVAHAGLRQEFQGRASARVREFALYGETTGETDEYGLPVRHPWAESYRGRAQVVYGHTPVPEPVWTNGTLCVDTGCVYGGQLTALRWPERELLQVAAREVYFQPTRPLTLPDNPGLPEPTRGPDDLLDIGDVLGKRLVTTRLQGPVTIREANAVAALEVMSRYAVDPRWLIYLPPTMSPSDTCPSGEYLERPAETFAYFRHEGLPRVVCQQKHMGSRAVLVVCRGADAARRRFRTPAGESGVVLTRTGRPFCEPELAEALLDRVRAALTRTGLWEQLATDWVCLDAELMPWSAKAQELLRTQYAPTGAAALAGLDAGLAAVAQASARGLDCGALAERLTARRECASRYVDAWRRYCWRVEGLADLKLAPFHLLASEGRVHTDRDHRWHMATLAQLCAADPELLLATPWLEVDVTDPESEAAGSAWWEELTAAGGEGMVVKPLEWNAKGRRGLAQPALKCRGREYLRIIYGPDYTLPDQLDRLRQRGVGAKRSLALREYALGLEALHRFVAGEPLYRVHECVFGVLALESEPVDPRL